MKATIIEILETKLAKSGKLCKKVKAVTETNKEIIVTCFLQGFFERLVYGTEIEVERKGDFFNFIDIIKDGKDNVDFKIPTITSNNGDKYIFGMASKITLSKYSIPQIRDNKERTEKEIKFIYNLLKDLKEKLKIQG